MDQIKARIRSELADTLDLVIVGALHGRGRRVGNMEHYSYML